MAQKKSIILIDGSNFYFKLKSIGLKNIMGFNFSAFAAFLAKKTIVVGSIYYVGAVKTGRSPKARKMHSNQQKLLANLRKNKFQYSLGYLLKSSGKYHEKGVDVNIAVDILVAAYEKQCNRIILVSSDTDLLPAIKKAKEKGVIIEYIGFSHQPSLAMIANCSESTLLKKDDIEPLIDTHHTLTKYPSNS